MVRQNILSEFVFFIFLKKQLFFYIYYQLQKNYEKSNKTTYTLLRYRNRVIGQQSRLQPPDYQERPEVIITL